MGDLDPVRRGGLLADRGGGALRYATARDLHFVRVDAYIMRLW